MSEQWSNEKRKELIITIIRERGPQSVFSMLNIISEMKKEDPEKYMGLTGCEDVLPKKLHELVEEGTLKKRDGLFILSELKETLRLP